MKNLFLLFLLFQILISCTTKSKIMETENEKLVRQYFEYFNSHNWTKMAEMYVKMPILKTQLWEMAL